LETAALEEAKTKESLSSSMAALQQVKMITLVLAFP
jgi:hypothetical protein